MAGEEEWSQWSGLNRRPTVYETVALPLSYTGVAACPIHCGSRAGFVGGTKAVGKWDFGMGVNLSWELPVSQKPVASYGAAWGHAAYRG
jgi:hypothetical protein